MLLFKLFYFFLFYKPKYFIFSSLLLIFMLNNNNYYYNYFILDQVGEVLSVLCMIVFLMSLLSVNNMSVNIFMLMVFSNIINIFFFSSMNMFFFFLFFEMSLIPVLLLILGWGYQVERLFASYMLLLYTSIFSFPFLIIIFFSFKMSFNMYMCFLSNNILSNFSMCFLCGVFLVKTPLYFFHFWLPKAHLEASVTGSIILSGILLKMGGYGLYRMFLMMNFNFLHDIMWLFLMSGFFSIIICLVQSDLKSMIAFSSINHMSLMVFSMAQLSVISFKGSLFMMLIHGLSSSLMFFMMNYCYYNNLSRLFYFTQFMFSISKSFSVLVFWVFLLNISFPPLLSFFSEMLMFFNLIFMNKIMIFYIVIMSLLSCYYSIFMLTNMLYGKIKLSVWNIFPMMKMNLFMFSFIMFSLNLILILMFF